MNNIAADILKRLKDIYDEDDTIYHYGVPKRSGRYPWGSGEQPYQHSGDFLSRIEDFKKRGYSENEIAKELNCDVTQLRVFVTRAKHERRQLEVDRAKSLRADGLSLREIAKEMGYNSDSSIRSLLNDNISVNKNRAVVTADILRKQLEEKKMIDVGKGVELTLGCTANTLNEAVTILEAEGYNRHGVGVPQVTNSKQRTITDIIARPDIDLKYAINHIDEIDSVEDYHSNDGGSTYIKAKYPASIDSNRVQIRYAEDGGKEKDGTIEIRRGVDDLNLGDSHYAQVRILVDGTHYIKGMAIYSDNMPEGTDIVFNTNKHSDVDKMSVLKEIKNDPYNPENPFGATISAMGQSYYIDKNGNEKLSAINKIKQEGDWEEQSKTLSSQFLSKQPKELISKQLDLTFADKMVEFEEIMSYNNPTIKRKMLEEFADSCESAAIDLKAIAYPRQRNQVILPITSLKDDEVFAPNFKDGEMVALIRYPHGGKFEIPILKVNNKNAEGKSVLGTDIMDAVGINSKVAERLSGADFDGDSVTVIPTNNKVRIQSKPPLRDLEGFDAKDIYSVPKDNPNNVRLMKKSEVQKEMGMISNLITDMTLVGADDSELARAVKHSMVVIDAYKHKLDYKRSEKDNNIKELKEKYQHRITEDGTEKIGGATTLLSRRKQEDRIPERQGSPRIDPETGELIYKQSGRKYIDNKTGKVVEAKTKVNIITNIDDARKLSSGTVAENLYADYINKLKALTNTARKEAVQIKDIAYDPQARVKYANEVNSILSKYNNALKESPKERLAQRIALTEAQAKIRDNDVTDKSEIKKIKQQAITKARGAVGKNGQGTKILFTDREWEAVQAGALSPSKLKSVLDKADSDAYKSRALPRASTTLSSAKEAKMKAMSRSGYTNSQIAESLGISISTVIKNLNEG